MTAAELRARGNAALGEGRLEEACELYRQAAKADPKDPVAWLNMGFARIEMGQWAAANESLGRAIALSRPGEDFLPDAHYLRGRALHELGDALPALGDFEAAVSARPGFAEPMESAAQASLDLKRFDEALAWANRARAARPNPQMELVAAQALDKLDRPAEALQTIDVLLAQDPKFVTALEGRGTMLLRLSRPAEALDAFQRAIAIEGESASRLSSVAVALHRLARFDEAAATARRALALAPDRRDEAYNLAAVLLEMLRIDEAMQILQRVSARWPGDADIGWNLAIGHLLRGELAEGFAAYEHRFLCDAFGWRKPAPDFGRPRWTGRESLEGRSILLFAEQGLGDSIQLLRYVPFVAARAREVVLRLPRALTPLLQGLPANCRWVSESEDPPRTDYQCPIMSLPAAFGTTLETLPAKVPYLAADPARVAAWRERLGALGPSPRVGIVWSGNASHPNDRNRSIALETFRAIARDGVQFVSLQPEVREKDRPAYDSWKGLARFGEELRDFADTAALVTALDLVVTVDTSVAHVTGALGRPLWVLVPHYPDWRWMLGREDSPWYPSARIWRQPEPRDWPSVLARVRGELERVKGIEPSS
ncbi:MAG TPA: tetratricopeptide repeat protein [Usitatibacter sp.]|nr:tetratricopeptide repeat protein [Usitatibacter sp.]